jgi:hypothetical protein
MSIYDKAGIALIPSGTKASKLYSVLPANGDGDFTHSRGSTATRVNKDGLIESVATNVPRLDYPLINGVVQDCPASLLEPSRTNGLQRTEEFDNSYWNKSLISVTANDSVSPDGSQNADKIVSGNSTGNHFFRRTSLTYSATDNTFSIFAKFTDDLFEQFHIIIYDGSNHSAYFDVKNGSVISADSGVTASMINYGSGWYRCIATYQTASTSIGQIKVELGSTSTITGDGSSGMLFWGMMWEVGSYATSYIPWDGSGTTTRSADVCNGSGTSAEFNDSEGVLFAEVAALADDGTSRRLSISDGSNNNQVSLIYGASNQISPAIYSGGSFQMGGNYTLSDQTDTIKVAIKYNANDAALWVNGFEVITDTSITTPIGLNQVRFEYGGGSNDFYGKVKQLIVFNKALSDSELQTLTS